MRACQTHQGGGDFQPGGLFGPFHGMGDRLCGRGQVNDHTFADAIRRLDPYTEDANQFLILDPPDERAYFGGSYIDAYNDFFHNY